MARVLRLLLEIEIFMSIRAPRFRNTNGSERAEHSKKEQPHSLFLFFLFPPFLTRSLFLPLLSFLCFSFLFLCRRGVSTWKRTWPGETKAHDIKRTVNCRFRRRTVIQQGERSSFISDSGAGIRNPAKQRRAGNLAEKSWSRSGIKQSANSITSHGKRKPFVQRVPA